MVEIIFLDLGGKKLPLHVVPYHGKKAVVLGPLCTTLGMPIAGQYRKTYMNPQFTDIQVKAVDVKGANREMSCLPLSQLAMWLCTVNVDKVSVEYRAALLKEQRHLQTVMSTQFVGRYEQE